MKLNDLQREARDELREDIARCKSNLTRFSSYPVDVVLNVGGCETEFRADVYFEFTPAEPRAWDYPGCPAQAEVLHVMVGDTDIVKLMSQEALKELGDSFI